MSTEGFDYINSVVCKGCSRQVLGQILDSLVSPNIVGRATFDLDVGNKRRHKRVKDIRKESQFRGIVSLVRMVGYKGKNIVEVGCGNGRLARHLALEFPNVLIEGLEKNEELVAKARERCYDLENISFEEGNAFDYTPKSFGLVISLHGCGNLTDRVTDIACDSGANVICVPCCYGKIEEGSLPRSNALKRKSELYKKVLKKTNKMGGFVSERDSGVGSVLRDLNRFLVNFDRALYLKERGYNVSFSTITERETGSDGNKLLNSSLRYAIIGEKK